MRQTQEMAYAKLNISLDVTEKRSDGFHNMVMVMQTVSLCDELSIRMTEDGRIRCRSNLHFIPSDERNLAVRAVLRYLERIGESGQGLELRLHKKIPVGAGMAGGSSDAAAVLRALNRLYDRRLSLEELEELGSAVGSDVAFCVAGGTALARGRGELLSPLEPLPDCHLVICKPEFSISTPELFRKLDAAPLRRHPDTAGLLKAIEEGDLHAMCRRMYNVFEDVEDRRMRTVGEIRGRLLDHGALGAIMTGTGSAVFGVFDRAEQAEQAAREMKKELPFACVARPVGRISR